MENEIKPGGLNQQENMEIENRGDLQPTKKIAQSESELEAKVKKQLSQLPESKESVKSDLSQTTSFPLFKKNRADDKDDAMDANNESGSSIEEIMRELGDLSSPGKILVVLSKLIKNQKIDTYQKILVIRSNIDKFSLVSGSLQTIIPFKGNEDFYEKFLELLLEKNKGNEYFKMFYGINFSEDNIEVFDRITKKLFSSLNKSTNVRGYFDKGLQFNYMIRDYKNIDFLKILIKNKKEDIPFTTEDLLAMRPELSSFREHLNDEILKSSFKNVGSSFNARLKLYVEVWDELSDEKKGEILEKIPTENLILLLINEPISDSPILTKMIESLRKRDPGEISSEMRYMPNTACDSFLSKAPECINNLSIDVLVDLVAYSKKFRDNAKDVLLTRNEDDVYKAMKRSYNSDDLLNLNDIKEIFKGTSLDKIIDDITGFRESMIEDDSDYDSETESEAEESMHSEVNPMDVELDFDKKFGELNLKRRRSIDE